MIKSPFTDESSEAKQCRSFDYVISASGFHFFLSYFQRFVKNCKFVTFLTAGKDACDKAYQMHKCYHKENPEVRNICCCSSSLDLLSRNLYSLSNRHSNFHPFVD
jgi:hypothetical protein